MQIIQTKHYPNVCTNFKKFLDEMNQNRKKEDYVYGRNISGPFALKLTERQKWRSYQIWRQDFMQTCRRRRVKYPGWYTNGRMVQNQRGPRRHAVRQSCACSNHCTKPDESITFCHGSTYEVDLFLKLPSSSFLPKEAAGGLSFPSLRHITNQGYSSQPVRLFYP